MTRSPSRRPGTGPIQTMRFLFALAGAMLWRDAGASASGWLIDVPNFAGLAPPQLHGYLARPSGAGRLPAVVILHGCNGFSSGAVETADRLRGWGYVALAVDSLGPRGIDTTCGASSLGQEIDGEAALDYLSQQDFVDPARVAVLGYSMGGGAALRIAQRGGVEAQFEQKFHAVVAYYPWCGDTISALAVPTLILIGASDDWTPAEACRDLAGRLQKDSARLDLTVYPGAFHAFNFRQVGPGFRNDLGHWLAYDEPAAADAEAKLRTFFAAHLSSDQPR